MLEQILDAVKAAGRIMRDADPRDRNIQNKSSVRDVVTAQDKAIQSFLFDHLAKILPDALFVSEENRVNPALHDGYCFIIDPIDGTANFARGCKNSCVSVALIQKGLAQTGAVYDPYLDELFWAQRGKGAYLNGVPIQVSDLPLAESLVGFGTCPYDLDKTADTFALARAAFEHSMDVRRSGTSALDICYTACGRFGLFFELILYPWDYAAAGLILQEAGGVITDTGAGPCSLSARSPVVAGAPRAHGEFLALYRQTLR